MKFIEDELNRIGRVNYTEYMHDDRTGGKYKTDLITAEISLGRANGCRIEYHSAQTPGGKVITGPPILEIDHTISLADYDYRFVVTRLDLDMDARNSAGGHPEYKHRVEP